MKTFDIPKIENTTLAEAIDARWNSLTKPRGSLGRLENLVKDFALQRGSEHPTLANRAIYVFCADHGVTEEGVSAYPSEVTRQMLLNFVAGGAAINVLCRQLFIRAAIIDAGVRGAAVPGVMDCKIGPGTRNFAKEPAMTRDDAIRAIEFGAQLTAFESDDIYGVGEMGIGNSTSASALLCAFAGVAPSDAVGPGTGLDPAGVKRKAEVIERALALHKPDPADPIATVAALGGYEIAMMAGFLLGTAESRIPVMMDGFISCAAALVAREIEPRVMDYLHFSHQSAEPGHAHMLSFIGAKPLFTLSMRLGEGTGAALGINLLSHALALYDNMATFQQASVTSV